MDESGRGLNKKNTISGRVPCIEEEEEQSLDTNFKLPPIKGDRSSIGATNNYYRKEKIRMAKLIAKEEELGQDD